MALNQRLNFLTRLTLPPIAPPTALKSSLPYLPQPTIECLIPSPNNL